MMPSLMVPLGVSAGDDSGLASVFEHDGPFVTLEMSTPAAKENAPQELRLRWKELRRSLETDGAPMEALEAIERIIPTAHTQGHSLAAVADSSGLLLKRHGPELLASDAGWVAPLPRLGRMISWRQEQVPYIVVFVDHLGADIQYVGPGEDWQVSVGMADSHDPLAHRSGPGGWSQPRYQRRAENLWRTNANEAAGAVARIAEANRARFIALAGSSQSKSFFVQSLPEEKRSLVKELGGARHPDGGEAKVAWNLQRLVASEVAAETASVLHHLRSETERCTKGLGGTIAALQQAKADTVVLHYDPDDRRKLWFGPGPEQLSLNRSSLVETGMENPRQAALVDVVVRSAWGTGATIRLVPRSTALADGIGALLRY